MALRIFTEPQQGASYDELLAIARATESCGFDAFFRSDHLLKMGAASGLPAYTDAWTTLAGLARDTTRIRLGTLVTPVTFRPIGSFPALVAQVDQMSGGRLEIGLGAGWYEDEHRAYGLEFPPIGERYDLLTDALEILDGLWSTPAGGELEYSGRRVQVHLRADSLRPAQDPHPPVIIGGHGGPRNAALGARFADEFNTAFAAPEKMRTVHDSVRRACESAGRDPGEIVYSVAQVVCCGEDESEVERRAAAIGRSVEELRENGLAGTPDEILERIADFTDAGAERLYLQVLDIRDLEHLELIAATVQPQVELV